ncbi:MAG: thrombospondin type 3 repeat-containing protein [Nitrospirae bacterium]|nr:thrombospondin type 3 repeat-containing protein [Nitrospirota bacterium]
MEMVFKSGSKALTGLAIVTFIFFGATLSYSAETIDYVYDDLNRLESVLYENGAAIDYYYDEVGNRENKIVTMADTDGDGIPDDGDLSGTAGDNSCTGGNTVNCDDNCYLTPNPDQADSDGDKVGDVCDNCRLVANPDQRDSNSADDDNLSVAGTQHYGDLCDPDFDNTGFVNIIDYNEWRRWSGQTVPPAPAYVDLDGNGTVWIQDFNIWRKYYGKAPGPGIGD